MGDEHLLGLSGLDSAPLATAAVEGARHIVCYVNAAFCAAVDKTKQELMGKPFAEIMQKVESLSLFDDVYRTGKAITHTELEDSAAHPVYWSYVLWPIPGEDKRPEAVVFQVIETARFHLQSTAMNQQLLLSAVRQHELAEVAEKLNAQLQLEIAERKRMEGALLNSEKLAATARLANTMAHEINNPLAAITNLVYLLGPLQTSPEARAYVATLDQQIRGLSLIASQMLKFHRDSNLPAEFKVSGLLNEACEFLQFQAEAQGILLEQRIETEGTVVGYRGEIVQVISNLLLNSLAATPSGGKIRVHLYPAPNWLCEIHNSCGYCLSVSDSGGGIAPEHLGRIFEPFYTTKGDKGTGLGLWLCLGIVTRVGGTMRVRSTDRAGRSGTCFLIFLPAEEASSLPHRRRYETA